MLCASFLRGRLVPTTLLVELMYPFNLWTSEMLPRTSGMLQASPGALGITRDTQFLRCSSRPVTTAVLFQEWGDAAAEWSSASCCGMEQGCHWADGAMLCCAIPDPAFVRAQLIPDSSERNDDKLYFFFREKSADAPLSPGVYSRIGRICLVGVAEDRQGSRQGDRQG